MKIVDDEEYEKRDNFFIELGPPRWLKRGISGRGDMGEMGGTGGTWGGWGCGDRGGMWEGQAASHRLLSPLQPFCSTKVGAFLHPPPPPPMDEAHRRAGAVCCIASASAVTPCSMSPHVQCHPTSGVTPCPLSPHV